MAESLSNKTIVICSIVRNAAKGLQHNIPVINKLCAFFKDYRIVVFENDSVDRTKEILQEWHLSDPERIHVFMDDFGKPTIPAASEVNCNRFFSLIRIQNMARFRNQYLDYIEQKAWNPTYLLVVDLDVSRISLKGVLSSFETDRDWDAVTAFGYSMSPKLKRRYHDVYILVKNGEEDIPQTEESIARKADEFMMFYGKQTWIPVYSAFGGLAIYKYDKVKGLRYSAIPNDDDRVQSRGEHFSLYKQMSQRGPVRVYINPQMTIKYQDVDLKLIFKTLKRLMGIRR